MKLRREKKRNSTRALMDLEGFTDYGIRTVGGELAAFLVQPTNISVLSHANVEQKEKRLCTLLSLLPGMEFVCLDSCERFDDNRRFLKQRITEEENPAVRAVLEQESDFLESKQIEMATARQFLIIWRFTRGEMPGQVFQDANEIGRKIADNGFEVRLMEKDDIKRVLGLYFGTSMTGEAVEDVDGAKNFDFDGRSDT